MWTTHIEGGPKRVNHAAVSVGHKIYSFGGYCTGENSRGYASIDVHVLNSTTFRWTQHPVSDLPFFEYDDILPYKRYGHTAVVYDSKIYIWGGRNDRTSCNTLFCFDTVWHCWTAPKTTGNIPPGRDGHSACQYKNFMFIFGGYEEDTQEFARSVYYLDFHTMHWSMVTMNEPQPTFRDFHTTVCIGDRMYLFGGRGPSSRISANQSDEMYCNELWYFDLKFHQWHKVNATGDIPIGRRSHSAFVYQGKMFIFGGYNSVLEQHFDDMYQFEPKTSVWKQLHYGGLKPTKRRRQCSIVVEDRVFLFGGTSPQDKKKLLRESDDKLIDHSDMYVLDFKPTLRTLSMKAVNQYGLDISGLPVNLKQDLLNMCMPNKITVMRPSNSAG